MSVTHVAGPPVTVGSTVIQRCACCGEKLVDNRGQMGCIGPNGEPPGVLLFPQRHFVHCSGSQPRQYLSGGDFAAEDVEIPEDFCLSLVEPGFSGE